VGVRFLKMAVVYILVGICIGIYMGITLNFALTSVHAHTNLFGWATLALCGFTYLRFPKAAESPLAKWHFWLQGIGLPIMLISLTLMAHGYAPNWVTTLKHIGEAVAGIGIFVFAVNVFTNIKAMDIHNNHKHDISL
jgi:cbb3-type cytochrome oxidase subunit 1